MREYGQIQSGFWQSSDAEGMSDRAKLLACYLLTGPYTNGLGCFRLTEGNLIDDFGWVSETVLETESELYRIGFAYRFGKVIFIPNFLRWNGISNPKVAIARLKELETLPTRDAKALAARVLLKFCNHLTASQVTLLQTVSDTVSDRVLDRLSKQNPTLPNPTQNQKETSFPQKPAKPKKSDEGFDEFWSAYPRKVGKEDALKAFVKISPDAELLAVMLKAIAAQSKSEQWAKDRQFIPHPATWLNGKRWQDDIDDAGNFHASSEQAPDWAVGAL
jgi:hypothetical protein